MLKINKIAQKYHLKVIEDASEAVGAEINGLKVGQFGEVGIFAFYPNKQMTTGEGGMIVTNNKKVAELCRSMRNQGRNEDSKWLEHNRLGFNYRLSDINCALGIAQLERINELLKKRERVAKYYKSTLTELENIKLPLYGTNIYKRSWFVYVILLNSKYSERDRNKIIERLRIKGITSSIYFPSIHLQTLYKRLFNFKKGAFPVSESVSERSIALPFYSKLTYKNVKYIASHLRHALSEIN